MTRWQVIQGDCLAVMASMDADSVDALVTDPPYGINFMGKSWDGRAIAARRARPSLRGDSASRRAAASRPGRSASRSSSAFGSAASIAGAYDFSLTANQAFQAWCESWAREALRVLKPSGLAVVFGGTRTYHRLTCGLEDAGFEIRDQLDWLYGSGFPKHPSALKPAHEPIVLARKAGARSEPLNIDACRIGFRDEADEREAKEKNRHADFGSGPRENKVYGADNRARGEDGNYDAAGRWPANVIVDGVAAAMIDEQSGVLHSQDPATRRSRSTAVGVTEMGTGRSIEYADVGGASRFFYCAKPSAAERNAGLDGFEAQFAPTMGNGIGGKEHDPETATPKRNVHPTVKPVELMRWLIRLVTPEGGTVLDPFTGSGTTGIAALREQRSFIGIEREADYLQIARARIVGDAPLLNSAMEAA